MTLADKKIAEFDNEFWLSLIKYNSNLAKQIRNWILKTIAEAKKDELYEVRKILRDNSDPIVWEKIRERILKLDAEK